MLEDYVKDWNKKPWAWKQGWLSQRRDPCGYENPHGETSSKYRQFEDGWETAEFCAKIDGGYYDW